MTSPLFTTLPGITRSTFTRAFAGVTPDARVIASSGFTPYAGLAWGEDAISFQCHPEFQPDYAAALEQVQTLHSGLAELDQRIAQHQQQVEQAQTQQHQDKMNLMSSWKMVEIRKSKLLKKFVP